MTHVSTQHLPLGELVYTTDVLAYDFGLPLVEPNTNLRGRFIRVVRNRVKCRGGHVVWFTDGTKTPPLHGRTVWTVAEPFLGDPREGQVIEQFRTAARPVPLGDGAGGLHRAGGGPG